jgi:hypothetical protein
MLYISTLKYSIILAKLYYKYNLTFIKYKPITIYLIIISIVPTFRKIPF